MEEKRQPPENIPWLSEEDYSKAVMQLRFQIRKSLDMYNIYGLQNYTPMTENILVKLCEDFSLRVRGLDHMISYEDIAGTHRSPTP